MFTLACKQDVSAEKEVVLSTTSTSDERITKKDIQSLKYTDYGLSNDAKAIVENWQKYQELSNQINLLLKADLEFYKSDVSLVIAFLNDFKTEMPKQLKTNEIKARITVLETGVLKINSLLLLDNIAKSEKLQAIKELLIAYSNLKLQINKKLEFEANDIFKTN